MSREGCAAFDLRLVEIRSTPTRDKPSLCDCQPTAASIFTSVVPVKVCSAPRYPPDRCIPVHIPVHSGECQGGGRRRPYRWVVQTSGLVAADRHEIVRLTYSHTSSSLQLVCPILPARCLPLPPAITPRYIIHPSPRHPLDAREPCFNPRSD